MVPSRSQRSCNGIGDRIVVNKNRGVGGVASEAVEGIEVEDEA